MSMAFMVNTKINFVDGSIEKIIIDKPKELQQWNHYNNLVKTWLIGSMSKENSGNAITYKNMRQNVVWITRNIFLS